MSQTAIIRRNRDEGVSCLFGSVRTANAIKTNNDISQEVSLSIISFSIPISSALSALLFMTFRLKRHKTTEQQQHLAYPRCYNTRFRMQHHLCLHYRLVGRLLLAVSLLASLVLGDRLLLRRPSLLGKKRIVLKNYLPFDEEEDRFVDVKPLTERKEPSVNTNNNTPPSVPRRLLQPFAAALLPLPPSSSSPNANNNNNHNQHVEIRTEKLMDACRTLKDTMISLGQVRNAAEIERNLQKFEALHRMAPPSRRETLRSLLEYEKELGVHGADGRLKDPSGAMGLLWIRRSLAFQERMYSLLLEQPALPPNQVALQAYHETLQPYHGFALQQLYSVALKKTTPPRHDIFQKLGALPEDKFGVTEERETARDLRELCETWKPLLNTWEEIYHTLGLEDHRRA